MKAKKFFSIISMLTMVASIPFNASAASALQGDANGDSVVDIRDAAYIARCVAKHSSLGEECDFNNDGKTNIIDAAAIAKCVACKSFSKEKNTFSSMENEVLELVNQEREKVGAAPLTLDSTLCEMANVRAIESSKNFSHTRSNGRACFTIFDDYKMDYSYCGENLAAGNSEAEATVEQWINSPGHYANMIDPEFTEIGIGYCYDESSPYKYHWVQIFRCP